MVKSKSKSRSPKSGMRKSSNGRGSQTRGWKLIAPKTSLDRRVLRERCGRKCFLDFKTLGYPVCRDLDESRGKCLVDCRGILAAKVRSGQFKNTEVYDKAQKLGSKKKCKWTN